MEIHMKIYMDNCCFNRLLDNRKVFQIYYECNSVEIILELVEEKHIKLYGSDILKYEISETPSDYKRERLELMYSLCSSEIKITREIIKRAAEIQEKSNIKHKDSLHLACAESVDVDVFLTVDKKFANNAKRLPSSVRIANPTEFLMEVFYGKDS